MSGWTACAEGQGKHYPDALGVGRIRPLLKRGRPSSEVVGGRQRDRKRGGREPSGGNSRYTVTLTLNIGIFECFTRYNYPLQGVAAGVTKRFAGTKCCLRSRCSLPRRRLGWRMGCGGTRATGSDFWPKNCK